jgi:hypothetical protein
MWLQKFVMIFPNNGLRDVISVGDNSNNSSGTKINMTGGYESNLEAYVLRTDWP